MKQKLNAFYMRNRDISILLIIVIAGLSIGFITGLIYNSQKNKTGAEQMSSSTIQAEPLFLDKGVFGDVETHSSADGEIVIGGDFTPVPMSRTKDPETIWSQEQYTGGFTATEKVALKDGSMGVLPSIESGYPPMCTKAKTICRPLGKMWRTSPVPVLGMAILVYLATM